MRRAVVLAVGGMVLGILAGSPARTLAAPRATAQRPADVIARIDIEGNSRVDVEAIRIHVKSKAGERVNSATIDSDVRSPHINPAP